MELAGTLESTEELAGTLESTEELAGTDAACEELAGTEAAKDELAEGEAAKDELAAGTVTIELEPTATVVPMLALTGDAEATPVPEAVATVVGAEEPTITTVVWPLLSVVPVNPPDLVVGLQLPSTVMN